MRLLRDPFQAQVTGAVVEEFINSIIRGLSETDPEMIEAVRKLKEAGFKLGVLTNNWRSERAGRLIFKEVELFDKVVESCVVGMRKPEEAVYRHTLRTLGVEAEEAVFLDDIASNLKPASRMGISTIKVNDVTSALGELQTLLEVDLGVTAGTSRIRRGMEIDEARLETYLAEKLNISGE